MPIVPNTVLFPWQEQNYRRQGYHRLSNGTWVDSNEYAGILQRSRERLAEANRHFREDPISIGDSLRQSLHRAVNSGREIWNNIGQRIGEDAVRQGREYEQGPLVSWGLDAIQDHGFRNRPYTGALVRSGLAGAIAAAATSNPVTALGVAMAEGVRGTINAYVKNKQKKNAVNDPAAELLAEETAENEQLKKQNEQLKKQLSPLEYLNNLQIQKVASFTIPAQQPRRPEQKLRKIKLVDALNSLWYTRTVAGF